MDPKENENKEDQQGEIQNDEDRDINKEDNKGEDENEPISIDKLDELFSHLMNINKEQEGKKKLTEEEKKKIKDEKYKEFIDKMKSCSFKNVIFLTGAGISTSAGIPDFRSKNGLFQQLQEKYNLSRPEDFFNIRKFFESPEYFYEFTKNFQNQKYSPTPFHYFMGFLDSKKMVRLVFTQNIDGLELSSGLDDKKIIFAHGNFIQAHCPKCHTNIDTNKFNEYVNKGEILYCEKCNSPCKSKVVFYGEALPKEFFLKMDELNKADLVIICGTSLVVSPFNELPYINQDENCWRVVINKEKVGNEYGRRGFKYDEESKDLLIEGYSDDIVNQIVKECGWENDFKQYIEDIKKSKV